MPSGADDIACNKKNEKACGGLVLPGEAVYACHGPAVRPIAAMLPASLQSANTDRLQYAEKVSLNCSTVLAIMFSKEESP